MAMDFYCENIETLESYIAKSGLPYSRQENNPYTNAHALLLTDTTLIGNTFMRFIEN